MKSFLLTEGVVVLNQDILNYKKNLILFIYQEKEVFGFRVFTRNKKTGKKEDALNKSTKEDWAYGPFSSPEDAEEKARELAQIYAIAK